MDRKEELQIEFLYRALAEARETVQFVDMKAGTIILFVVGLLALVGAIHVRIDTLLLQILATILLASLVLAAVCSIWALHPRSNPEIFVDTKGIAIPPLYYIRSIPPASPRRKWLPFFPRIRLEMSAAEYLRHLDSLDGDAVRQQLAYELLKVSLIREEKIYQVNWAVRFMQAAGGFLALLILGLYVFSRAA